VQMYDHGTWYSAFGRGSTRPASCICGPECPTGSICLIVLVFDGVKSFAKVKGNDDDKPVDGEEISDGVQDSDDSSCG